MLEQINLAGSFKGRDSISSSSGTNWRSLGRQVRYQAALRPDNKVPLSL